MRERSSDIAYPRPPGAGQLSNGLIGTSGSVDRFAIEDRESRSHLPCIVEETNHVLRNLSNARVQWLRANPHEHVAHVLDQEKL